METASLIIENESSYSFEQTVEKLSTAILAGGWKITITHDLQATLLKHGKTVLPVKVIELCKPDHSAQLLETDQYRYFSSLMPCRISVYEKSDGKTYISRLNSVFLAKQIGGLVEKVMSQAFYDAEEMIKPLIL